jgi:hypothetical protein
VPAALRGISARRGVCRKAKQSPATEQHGQTEEDVVEEALKTLAAANAIPSNDARRVGQRSAVYRGSHHHSLPQGAAIMGETKKTCNE